MDAKKRQYLNKCAKEVLKFITDLDPSYDNRVGITKTEQGLDDLQVLGAYTCYVLDHGLHTNIPSNPFFAPDSVGTGMITTCPFCHGEYEAGYPGQPYCSNRCATDDRKVKHAAGL